jgi:hypothetical protein
MKVYLALALALALAALALASCAGRALASGFDCVQPEFPQRSTSSENVRQVQKQIRSWRTCYAGYGAIRHTSQDAQKLNAEVDASLQKWLDATRALTARNALAAGALADVERERTDYLRSVQLR